MHLAIRMTKLNTKLQKGNLNRLNLRLNRLKVDRCKAVCMYLYKIFLVHLYSKSVVVSHLIMQLPLKTTL